jgi:hypothetical protein
MTPAIRPMAAGTASQRHAGKRGSLLGPWLITSNRHSYHRTDSGAWVQVSRGSRSQAKEAVPGFVGVLQGLIPLPPPPWSQQVPAITDPERHAYVAVLAS